MYLLSSLFFLNEYSISMGTKDLIINCLGISETATAVSATVTEIVIGNEGSVVQTGHETDQETLPPERRITDQKGQKLIFIII